MSRNTRAARPLPDRPHPDKLKKDAKQLLRAWRAGEPDALAAVGDWHPRPSEFLGLRDAQLTLARSYGFADWQALSDAVELRRRRSRSLEERALLFVTDAALRYDGDDRDYRYRRAAAMLEQEPQLGHFDLFAALTAGRLPAVRATLAAGAVPLNEPGGPLARPPLLYLTYSRVPAPREDVLGILELLLEQGADPDSHVMLDRIYRFSAMAGAMGEGERGPVACPPHDFADELVAMLLDAGASPNEAQGLYNTQFTASIDKWLPLLIARGLDKNDRAWDDGGTQTTFDYFLAQAVMGGKAERVRLLLEHGADANAVNGYNGRSCHANAVILGHEAIAGMLLEHGARTVPLAAVDEFRIAMRRGDEAQMAALLERHPDLREDPGLLREAAHYGPARVDWLLDRGFDIDAQTPDGRTLLMDCALWNYLDGIQFLLERGADPDIVDKTYGATALGFALHHRHWQVADFLIGIGNNIHDLARYPDPARARRLLDQDPVCARSQTPLGNTPLHVVSEARDDDIDLEASAAMIDLLLLHGADLEARNRQGFTPLEWHRQHGRDQLADLLRERGASVPA